MSWKTDNRDHFKILRALGFKRIYRSDPIISYDRLVHGQRLKVQFWEPDRRRSFTNRIIFDDTEARRVSTDKFTSIPSMLKILERHFKLG